MKKYNKQRLFEVMGKVDKTFKPRLNETNEKPVLENTQHNSGFRHLTVYNIFDNNYTYIGSLDPIDVNERAGEFYMNTFEEIFATPEFQKFAKEKNITSEEIGKIKKSSIYMMDNNYLSFEHYPPSNSMELYDEKTHTFYNRFGQELRDPREYNRRTPGYTPFGDEGDDYY